MTETGESGAKVAAAKPALETYALFVRRELRTGLTLLPTMGVAAGSISCAGCLAQNEDTKNLLGE